jgi:EAL domain-containing protein (putative c-di-GMP-specific phosphodiesterase class I)
VPPASFIPAAERTGLIRPIGRCVLRDACAQGAAWQQRHQGDAALAVAVNLSVNQIQHPALVDEVASILEASGLAPSSLILEITETLLMEDLERGALARLKELGVQIAIDDFGTGYSSLQYLHRFPIDILKIDKSFVDGVTDSREPALARAIVELGESLHLRVIAEGLEHQDQVARMVELGCRWGQGYHYARPMSASELEAFLSRNGVRGWEHVSRTASSRVRPLLKSPRDTLLGSNNPPRRIRTSA